MLGDFLDTQAYEKFTQKIPKSHLFDEPKLTPLHLNLKDFKHTLEIENFNPLKAATKKFTKSDTKNADKAQEFKLPKKIYKALKPIYKALSPEFLLAKFKKEKAQINENFYLHLLHILGLKSVKNKLSPSGDIGSFYELIANKLSEKFPSEFGKNAKNTFNGDSAQNALDSENATQNSANAQECDERVISHIIIWLNRILFLKLVEANLIRFAPNKEQQSSVRFLNSSKIQNFDTLNSLFFDIFNKKPNPNKDINSQIYRQESSPIYEKFNHLPYLNSSLFAKDDKERILISELSDTAELVTAETKKNKEAPKQRKNTLKYLLEFLDKYDFGSGEEFESDTLISASVLGNVFERLNAYKEGSYYTPSFITAYMCRESLEKVVLQKFNEKEPEWNCQSLDDIENEIQRKCRKDRANETKIKAHYKGILNDIRICDPAVGSGHFMAAVLNQMVKIHYDLGLFAVKNTTLILQNEEIIIEDFAYEHSGTNKAQQIQKALFELKRNIIENNLFGVDINPNSVEICRLRLWIELLKNSYYLQSGDENYDLELGSEIHQMQTLPNIDINIKCGNSLISYFELERSLTHYPNIKERIKKYKIAVKDYKEGFYDDKTRIEKEIKALKESFRTFCFADKFKKEIKAFEKKCEAYSKKYGNFLAKDDENLSLYISQGFGFFDFDENEARAEFAALKKDYESIFNLESNKPLEWRFEFPELLNENGDFTGFDLIIGNPPYVVKDERDYPQYQWASDLYTMFFEMGFKLVKANGFLSFITPRFWLVNKNCEKMRKYFLNSVNLLSLAETNPFDKAVTENIISEFQLCSPKQNIIEHYKESGKVFHFIGNVDKNDFLRNSKCEIVFNIDKTLLALLDKICQNTTPLKSIMQTKRGAEYGKKFIKGFKNGMKILLGEDIKAYIIKWNETFVDTSLKDIQRLSGFFDSENLIYLRRVDNRLSACMSSEKFAFTKNIYGIKITNSKYSSKFILGLLNSNLLNFYYRKKFTLKKETVFPEIQTYLYEQLPISEINSQNSKIARRGCEFDEVNLKAKES